VTVVRWGIVGCGDVTEVKSGPGFQKADGSELVAVMRRNRVKAEDYARRHGVPRVHTTADALIDDPGVDAVYIATPPSSHRALALRVAAAGKPCLVEKPMARSHSECVEMIDAFQQRGVPLWVAYYRRALLRFLKVRELLREGAIGRVTAVHLDVSDVLQPATALGWRVDPNVAGAGLFFDLASHCFDLVEFLAGRIVAAAGVALNTGALYPAEDVTAAVFEIEGGIAGTGIWNFHADRKADSLRLTGSTGVIDTPVFADRDVVLTRSGREDVFAVRNPPHVHQPLIQTIVDELRGLGRCESTGDSGARASWVLDQCVKGAARKGAFGSF